MSVVLPEPKKPVSTVIGVGDISLMLIMLLESVDMYATWRPEEGKRTKSEARILSARWIEDGVLCDVEIMPALFRPSSKTYRKRCQGCHEYGGGR
jgi:hypothetical protein